MNRIIKTSIVAISVCFGMEAIAAGACNKASLRGNYNFVVMGSTSGDSEHIVGRITFNGAGTTSASGVDTYSGITVPIKGNGTYTINTNCEATGTINWTNGIKSTYWLYLDDMDVIPATALAYHGAFAVQNNNGFSASGEIRRVIGKF